MQPFPVQETVPEIVELVNAREPTEWLTLTRDDGRKLAVQARDVTWIGEVKDQ